MVWGEAQNIMTFHLDSDSDTDSEGGHDSEGETTDIYWSE
jgi:hypothetical protein